MSLSIYEVSVPTITRAVTQLGAVLEKGRLFAEHEKIDQAVLLATRLYPDMFTLARQVQVATDNAKGCVARLANVEVPKYEDTETSLAQLQERCARTLAFIQSVKASQFEGAESRPVVLKFPNSTREFKNGWDYLLSFALPNVYFHFTTAYAILRHVGVKVGKGDFLGPLG